MKQFMTEFVPVAYTYDLPDPGKLRLEIDDRFVVLVRIDDEFYCIDDICTHDGGTLGDGQLSDHCLVCPRHGAMFDVRSGNAVSMPATEPTGSHEVRVEGTQVYVRLAN